MLRTGGVSTRGPTRPVLFMYRSGLQVFQLCATRARFCLRLLLNLQLATRNPQLSLFEQVTRYFVTRLDLGKLGPLTGADFLCFGTAGMKAAAIRRIDR